MDNDFHQFDLAVAGQALTGTWDRLRRYCGLPWTGGPPETWAYPYYDAIETDPSVVGPADVVASAALHPGLSRSDLAYFHERSDQVNDWLALVPEDVPLREAHESVLKHLDKLAKWQAAPSLSLLTKVLHRKRPQLIPLVDRHILDWYRPVTGERSAAAAWSPLLRAMRSDLGGLNALLLAMMNVQLEDELGRSLGHLRLLDISIWMGSR